MQNRKVITRKKTSCARRTCPVVAHKGVDAAARAAPIVEEVVNLDPIFRVGNERIRGTETVQNVLRAIRARIVVGLDVVKAEGGAGEVVLDYARPDVRHQIEANNRVVALVV